MLASLSGLDPVDYARYGAIVVAFLVGGLSPEKTWLRGDVACSFGMGIGWLLFPQVFLGFQVAGATNQVHTLYCRSLGIHFIVYALPIIMNKRTRDDKVYTAVYLSRFLCFTMVLLATLYCHNNSVPSSVTLTSKHFWFNALAAGGWMFAIGRHMLASGGATNDISRQPENALKYHLFCDTLLLFLGAVYMLAFGEMAFSDLNVPVDPKDHLLIYISRVHAAFGIADSLYVLAAHSFDDKEAVKNHFKFRIILVAVYTGLQLVNGLLRTPTLIGLLIMYGAFAANSILALRHLNNHN